MTSPLRALLVSMSTSGRVRRLVTENRIARRVSRRFVAGETLEDAIVAVRTLTGRGFAVSLDYLGECVTTDAEADAAVAAYLAAARRLDAEGLAAELSVKPSSIRDSVERFHQILATGRDVTLDMEDHTRTDATLALLRTTPPPAWERTGIALQAYLKRTPADVAGLAPRTGRIRLTKGAYLEPDEIAWTDRRAVDLAFDRLTTALFQRAHAGGPEPAIATHDPDRILWACATATALRIEPSDFEFQMLYGVRRDVQERLLRDGYRVRIYVPYGDEWYPYLMRRIAERPANLSFFLRALAGR